MIRRLPPDTLPAPQIHQGNEADFNELALALFEAQFATNPAYRAICETRGVTPEKVTDWRRIPAAPTRAFKELELTSLPQDERCFAYHSSGTTGQSPSRHFHSVESMALYEDSLETWFRRHVLGDGADVRFIALTPTPAMAPHSSLVHMLDVVMGRPAGNSGGSPAPEECSFFGSLDPQRAWEVDTDKVARALTSAIETKQPVAMLGTAFNFVHLLDGLIAAGRPMTLPANSRLMETGGYKGRSRELSRDDLHAELATWLGLPRHRIITEYGMSELSSQAYAVRGAANELGWFAFPPWARALVVSPDTELEVPDGGRGLLRIFDLGNVWSVIAVQSEDLAIRHGDRFELLGRAVAAEPRGCSLMTADRPATFHQPVQV